MRGGFYAKYLLREQPHHRIAVPVDKPYKREAEARESATTRECMAISGGKRFNKMESFDGNLLFCQMY